MGDNVLDLGDDEYVYFNHINDILHDIKDGYLLKDHQAEV